MKKKVLGIFALVSLLVLPFVKVNADVVGGVVATTATNNAYTESNSTFVPSSNSFDGSFSLQQTDETVTLYAHILEGKSIPANYVISGTVNFSGSTYSVDACTAITSTTNYTVTCEKGADGKSAKFTATASKAITGEKKTKLATISINSNGATSADQCVVTLEITPGETPVTPKCKADEKNGVYYDNNGNQVTKEEYDKACTSENPQTGSAVSYVIIVGGILLAGAAFFMTKKSKIYNV